jgi:hypothetical protein
MSDWIDEAQCGGPWGSLIVLAPKPHQENITNIEDLLCMAHVHLLPEIERRHPTRLAFEYPIPRCDNAIDDFDDGIGRLWFISLDARQQGYHQIRVRLIEDRVTSSLFLVPTARSTHSK